METTAYHEGMPGHHLQISIAQEMPGLPEFRKHINYTAYVEGWGLYAERLGKDVGLYQDPYSDFGRLEADIYRAIRLVVDTGVHAQHWAANKSSITSMPTRDWTKRQCNRRRTATLHGPDRRWVTRWGS